MSENLPAKMGLAEVQSLGALLAKSGYFADARDAAQACVKVLAGQELGLPPIASMMGISLIKGKVTLSANLIAALVRQHGYDFRVERLDQAGCVLEFISKPAQGTVSILGKSTFTEADARAAGIKSEMYQKYPRNMYFARAISNGAKWFTPEIFGGSAVYTPDELGAQVDEEGSVVHEEAPAPAPVPARKLEVAPPPPPKPVIPEAKPVEEVPQLLAEAYATAKDFASTVAVISQFKPVISEFTGSDIEYYRILASHGMQHGNELHGRTRRQIKALIKDLFDFCTSISAAPQEVPAESEDPAWAALAEEV